MVSDYLTTLENRRSPDEVDHFYHPDNARIEYPNTLSRELTQRRLQELKSCVRPRFTGIAKGAL